MSNRCPCGTWEDDGRTFHGSSSAVRGLPLRYLIVDALCTAGSGVRVPELVSLLEEQGVEFENRPSKIVSDALRWEVKRGRVSRPRRGVYVFVGAPPSTLRRIQRRAVATRDFLRAADGASVFATSERQSCIGTEG